MHVMQRSMNQATYNPVQLFDATSSLVYGRHGDETESTRTPRLMERSMEIDTAVIQKTNSLIVDDGDLFYTSIPAELVVQVPLGATDTETENTENAGGVRGLEWGGSVSGDHEKRDGLQTI